MAQYLWNCTETEILFNSSFSKPLHFMSEHVHQAMGIKKVSVAQTQRAPCWTTDGTKTGFYLSGPFY